MPKAKEVVLDESDIPFPSSAATPKEVAELFGDEPPAEAGKGRVTMVVYKTNVNLGNHQHESVELTSTVGEGEDPYDVYEDLKAMGQYMINGE